MMQAVRSGPFLEHDHGPAVTLIVVRILKALVLPDVRAKKLRRKRRPAAYGNGCEDPTHHERGRNWPVEAG